MPKFKTLRTGSALALTAIKAYCPAVFATSVDVTPTRSARYAYIPTIEPLQALLERGWAVYEASQVQVKDRTNEPFCRHSLRLRRLEDSTMLSKYGTPMDGVGELTLTNAHDGTAAYTLTAGYYRLICNNGLTVGKQIASHRIVHTRSRATQEIIDVSAKIIEEDFPRMIEQIAAFQEAVLSPESMYSLARSAVALRYGACAVPPVTPQQLLNCRRTPDAGDTAWVVLNRIQENVMQGGWETRSVFTGRRTRVREIEAIVPRARINAGLWTACEELIK